jgi:hypothetical protein
MNAVVRALGIGTRLRAWTALLLVPLDPAGRPALPDVPFEMITASKIRTRWRALQWVRKWT